MDVRYTTRRHWYEVIAEASDFVFWSTVILLVVAPLATHVERRLGWFVLLCISPLAPLVKELFIWSWEIYEVQDFPSGKSRLAQKMGWWRRTAKEDDCSILAPTTVSTPMGRFLGFEAVYLTSATKQWFRGERVPVELVRQVRYAAGKKAATPPENERMAIVSNLSEWLRMGVLDHGIARAVVVSLIKDNL